MSRFVAVISFALLLNSSALPATKPHTIAFGKWTTVKWMIGSNEDQPIDLKIRPLLVDGHAKEYTVGTPHDITEHLFVVRRVFRLNDALPDRKSTRLNSSHVSESRMPSS